MEPSTRKRTRFVREGRFFAGVPVTLIDSDDGWSPYLSLEDAYKIDAVREALRRGDTKSASRSASVYELVPLSE